LEVIFNLIKFKVDHDNFEDICEELWQQNETIIKNNLIKLKNNRISILDLRVFNEMMDDLRLKCENLPVDWITTCTNQEFASYMTEIAIVMDVACRIVLG
jgi:hypothetical protein